MPIMRGVLEQFYAIEKSLAKAREEVATCSTSSRMRGYDDMRHDQEPRSVNDIPFVLARGEEFRNSVADSSLLAALLGSTEVSDEAFPIASRLFIAMQLTNDMRTPLLAILSSSAWRTLSIKAV